MEWQTTNQGRVELVSRGCLNRCLTGISVILTHLYLSFSIGGRLVCSFVMKMDVEMEEVLGLYNALIRVADLQLYNMDFTLNSKKIVGYLREGSRDIIEFGSNVNTFVSNVNILL